MKKLLLAPFVFLIGGLMNTGNSVHATSNLTEEYQNYEYNLKTTEKINYNDFTKYINDHNGTYYVYAGHKECGYCRIFSKTLHDFMDNNSTKIAYLDLNKLSSNMLSNLVTIIQNNQIQTELALPIVLKIENGKITKLLPGHYIKSDDLQKLIV